VIVKEAVANGRLTDRGDVPGLTDAAAQMGVTPDALALAAVLAQPWADVVLSGAATSGMAAANAAALDVSVDPEMLERLGGLAEDPDRYWERRSALSWN
jgi:aryl-alcohol dehydrogenase-like predicted oxidoreductase